jgi:hypothetical protein
MQLFEYTFLHNVKQQYVSCTNKQTNKQTNKKLHGLSPQAQTIPTERPLLVGEVGANFSG